MPCSRRALAVAKAFWRDELTTCQNTVLHSTHLNSEHNNQSLSNKYTNSGQ